MKKQLVHYKHRKFYKKRYVFRDLKYFDDRDDSGAYPTWLDSRSWYYVNDHLFTHGFRIVRNKQ